MAHDHSSLGIESQGHKSRSVLKVCVLHEYLLRFPVTDGRNSRFLLSRRQLRTSAARSSAWCGRGRRQRQSPARVGVVMRLRGRSDLDPWSRSSFSCFVRCTASFYLAVVACLVQVMHAEWRARCVRVSCCCTVCTCVISTFWYLDNCLTCCMCSAPSAAGSSRGGRDTREWSRPGLAARQMTLSKPKILRVSQLRYCYHYHRRKLAAVWCFDPCLFVIAAFNRITKIRNAWQSLACSPRGIAVTPSSV